MKHMININVDERYTCDQVLEHEWFNVMHDETTDESAGSREEDFIDSARKIKTNPVLKQVALNMLVKLLKIKPKLETWQEYHRTSEKGSSKEQSLKYSDFCVATTNLQQLQDPKYIKALFDQFDRNGNGQIDKEDINREFQTLGVSLKKSELKKILKPYDSDNKGYITYSEFENMIMSQ